jgi:hypothetical protein
MQEVQELHGEMAYLKRRLEASGAREATSKATTDKLLDTVVRLVNN